MLSFMSPLVDTDSLSRGSLPPLDPHIFEMTQDERHKMMIYQRAKKQEATSEERSLALNTAKSDQGSSCAIDRRAAIDYLIYLVKQEEEYKVSLKVAGRCIYDRNLSVNFAAFELFKLLIGQWQGVDEAKSYIENKRAHRMTQEEITCGDESKVSGLERAVIKVEEQGKLFLASKPGVQLPSKVCGIVTGYMGLSYPLLVLEGHAPKDDQPICRPVKQKGYASQGTWIELGVIGDKSVKRK